jgi:hypothetical protein
MATDCFFSEGLLQTNRGDVIGIGMPGQAQPAGFRIAGVNFRAGAGAPTAIASDLVGDIYFRTDGAVAGTCIYRCSVAGTTWVATSA